jgi:hypothetical protein
MVCTAEPTTRSRAHTVAVQTTTHPAYIPQEVDGDCRLLPVIPASARGKPCSCPESPLTPAYPGSTKTGLSRRRSRVRVPSLPSRKVPATRHLLLPARARWSIRPTHFPHSAPGCGRRQPVRAADSRSQQLEMGRCPPAAEPAVTQSPSGRTEQLGVERHPSAPGPVGVSASDREGVERSRAVEAGEGASTAPPVGTANFPHWSDAHCDDLEVVSGDGRRTFAHATVPLGDDSQLRR